MGNNNFMQDGGVICVYFLWGRQGKGKYVRT